MTEWLKKLPDKVPNARLGVIVAGLLLFIGWIDYITGEEISFSIFYVVPVAMAAWWGNKIIALSSCAASAAVWLAADLLAGHHYSHSLIPVWNAAVRFGFFMTIALELRVIRKDLNEKTALALTDYLTGLPNSRLFFERMSFENERSRRTGRPFSIAYIDLDNFKQVNDRRGHDEGDKVLKTVGETFAANMRKSDTLARMGGDEFLGLFPETGEDAAMTVAVKFREKFNNTMRDKGWPVTMSVGLITFNGFSLTPPEMVLEADHLMYKVKAQGKNGILHEVRE